jgi:hypothetical protein
VFLGGSRLENGGLRPVKWWLMAFHISISIIWRFLTCRYDPISAVWGCAQDVVWFSVSQVCDSSLVDYPLVI